jgi:hypothetical protein
MNGFNHSTERTYAMKPFFLTILVAAVLSTSVYAAMAVWTGRMEQVTTVSGLVAWNCQYQVYGKFFWRIFENRCPNTIEVR